MKKTASFVSLRHLSSSNRKGARACRRRILQASILGAFAAFALPRSALAVILDQYTFGPDGSNPGVLTPTTVGANVTATDISADLGLTLDLTSPATQPTTTPYLRTVPIIVSTTPDAAVLNEADFKFTLTANTGFVLNLTSLNFDVMRGGASTPRGYEVRSSVDNFATTLARADVPTARPALTPVAIDLSGSVFQSLPAITFKIYSYAPAAGASMDYDTIVVNGITTSATRYTWTGSVNGNWDTTSGNWSGAGTTYVDDTPASDVVFGDGPTRTTVNVSPAAVKPNAITFTNATAGYTFGGSAITVTTGIIKSAAGSVTFNNAVSSPSISASAGTITIGATGSLTSPLINVGPGATLNVLSGGSLGSASGLFVNGTVTLNTPTQSLATLAGATTGVLTLNGTVLSVAGASSFDGKVTGTGSIVKNASGTLALNGPNDFTGGITISSGAVQLGGATAGGTAAIVVNSGGMLAMAVPAGGGSPTNAIILNGGIVGSIGNQTVAADVTVNGPSAIAEFNPISGATGADFIITGMLLGTGNIDIQTRNANLPDGSAVRLRGPVSTYSGKVTVPESGKFELQTSTPSGSPMGTGLLVVTAGTTTTTNAGTFSIINVRNNSGGDVDLGNNVQVAGTGTSYFNLLGSAPAGSAMKFGDLLIGDGQGVGAVATASQAYTVAFNTVHLNGGTVTFTPRPVDNANFVSTENIRLGTVTQNAPSGITMNGAATLTFAGPATYSGATVISNGIVAVAGSISGSSGVALNGGTLTGAGTVSSPVTVGDSDPTVNAVVNPGGIAEIGTLTLGATSFNNADAQFQLELNSSDLTADRLVVNGALSLGTAVAQLIASDLGSAVLVGGNRLIIATATGGITGSFVGQPQGSTITVGTNPFTVSYLNNQITLTVIPEPASAVTLLGCLGLMAGLRRPRHGS